jgi:hypothetical protein
MLDSSIDWLLSNKASRLFEWARKAKGKDLLLPSGPFGETRFLLLYQTRSFVISFILRFMHRAAGFLETRQRVYNRQGGLSAQDKAFVEPVLVASGHLPGWSMGSEF